MNVSSLGISSARLPALPSRIAVVPDAGSPTRKATVNSVPAERVYVGEYVAAGTGPSFFFQNDMFSARRDVGSQDVGSKTGNRQMMVQAYVQNAGASAAHTRPSGRIDYFV